MQIAEALQLSEEALRLHLKEFQASRKLKPQMGVPRKSLFSAVERTHSTFTNPHLSPCNEIVPYVQSMWNITYTVSGMTDWLHRNRFSYKKPSLVSGQANLKSQEKWIIHYRKLVQNLPKDETICFGDGVYPTHNTQKA